MRVIMLVCGTVLVLTCTAFLFYEYITYRDITKRELQTLGQVTASNSTAALAFDSKEDADEILQALKLQKHIVIALLFDKDGKLFASYPLSVSPENVPSSIGKYGYRFTGKFIEGFEPVTQGDERLGTLFLRSDTKAIYQRFVLYGIIALAFILLSFVFAYLLSKRLQASISDPILELADKAKIVSDKKDYSIRAEKKTGDEIGTLTDAFNHMLTQIQIQNDEINALNANLEQKVVIRTRELQKANNSLSEQNEFIQTIIDSSVDVIAVFDKDFNCLVANKQAANIYGNKQDELVGSNLLKTFPAIKETNLIANVEKAFKGETVYDHVYKSVIPGHFFQNFFIPLKNDKDVVDRVLIIAHDITSIIGANEELKQLNAELEKSNRDLEQFAYVASHDLQEPLRKIQIFSELSTKNLQHQDIAKRYLEKIQSSAKRMTDLIKAVLNYSRLSKSSNEFTNVDLNEVMRNMQVDFELLIEEKKAIIKCDPLPLVKGIPLQLNQLFLNLFSNSMKFSEKQPEITVTSSIISPDQAQGFGKNGTSYHQIVFSDNGIGFDQQYAEQVFSIFQRLHSNDQYAGTGIGLALCKKIVENHSGYISVKSDQGKGTSFFIYLPVTQSDDNVQPAQSNIVATKI